MTGYKLHVTGACSTTYTKGDLTLTVYATGRANLSAVVGLATISIGPFTLPNDNFAMFERQILRLLAGA